MREGRNGEAGGVRFMEGGGEIRITNCKPAYFVFIRHCKSSRGKQRCMQTSLPRVGRDVGGAL